jgi:hypothetical protein
VPEPLQALAARLSLDPSYLGHTLSTYQKRHGMDDAALADFLGCHDVAVLTVLRCCRRPGVSAPYRLAAQDVKDLAARFGLDEPALWEVIGGE